MARSVPIASKSARRKKTKITTASDGVSAPRTSSLRKVGASDGGVLKMPSNFVNPSASAAAVDRSIPTSSAPFTPRAIRIAITASVAEREQHGRRRQPAERDVHAPGDWTMIPLHSSPMSVMSSPMPTPIACRIESGTAASTRSRTPNAAAATKIVPAIATAPSATGQGVPRATTTVYVKKKLWPIAGATAIG